MTEPSEVTCHTTYGPDGTVTQVDVYWPAGMQSVPVSKEPFRALLEQAHGSTLVWHEEEE